MTMSTSEPSTHTVVRQPQLDRGTAMALAQTAYERYVDLLRTLTGDDWSRATDCPAWDVRAMAAHNLGMAEFVTSPEENHRQVGAAIERGGVFIDALTALQVEERAGLSTSELVDRFAAVIPQAVAGRQYMPEEARQGLLPLPQHVNGVDEQWALGFLLDVILTRDVWMHRIDTCRAVGREPVLTADHDGVLVADVVAEWADRHGRPYTLRLDGPAGGSWSRGDGGEEIQLDAVEFCRILSGRASGAGLLSTEVPF